MINGIITLKEDKLIKSEFLGLQHFRHSVLTVRNPHHQRIVLKLLGVDMDDKQVKELLLGKAHEPMTPIIPTAGEDGMDQEGGAMEEQHEQEIEQREPDIEETPWGEVYHALEGSDEQAKFPDNQQGFLGVVTHDEAEGFGFES